jgi:hypothetical protein
MVMLCGLLNMVVTMEIDLGIPADWCQGDAEVLEPLDPEEYELPAEDCAKRKPKLKSIKVGRVNN